MNVKHDKIKKKVRYLPVRVFYDKETKQFFIKYDKKIYEIKASEIDRLNKINYKKEFGIDIGTKNEKKINNFVRNVYKNSSKKIDKQPKINFSKKSVERKLAKEEQEKNIKAQTNELKKLNQTLTEGGNILLNLQEDTINKQNGAS